MVHVHGWWNMGWGGAGDFSLWVLRWGVPEQGGGHVVRLKCLPLRRT